MCRFIICISFFIFSIGNAKAQSLSAISGSFPTTCYGTNDGVAWVKGLNGTGVYTYIWAFAPLIDNDTLYNLSPGSYEVVVSDGVNFFSQLITVEEHPKIDLGATKYDSGCGINNGAINVNINYPFALNYHWSHTSANVDSVGGLWPGAYAFWATDTPCSSDTLRFTLVDLGSPLLEVWDFLEILEGDSITIYSEYSSSNHQLFTWSPLDSLSCQHCQLAVANPIKDMTYTLAMYDSVYRCEVKDSVYIKVHPQQYWAVVPNTFSPNNDQHNDRFYIRHYGVASIKMQIFDKNGALLYESTDKYEGWNGIYKNQELPPDVYVYRYEGKFENGEPFYKQGTITLIR